MSSSTHSSSGTTLLRKLKLLSYPRAEHFDLGNRAEVVNAVAFLEDRYVRLRAIEARVPLRSNTEKWLAEFAAYLQELGCPLLAEDAAAVTEAELPGCVQWLVMMAVSANFEDNKDKINAGVAAAAVPAATGAAQRTGDAAVGAAAGGMEVERDSSAAGAAASSSSSGKPVDPAVEASIRELAALAHVHVEGRTAQQALTAIHRSLRQRILPAIAAIEAPAAAPSGKGGAAAASSSSAAKAVDPVLSLDNFPAGFETGSDLLDKASAVLRMLYIADLRELQDSVNEIIILLQQYTANPKTDASLGQVGR